MKARYFILNGMYHVYKRMIFHSRSPLLQYVSYRWCRQGSLLIDSRSFNPSYIPYCFV